MMIEVPVISFFQLISDLIQSINNDEPIILNVGVITTVQLGWTTIPFERRQDLTLKK